MVNVNLIIWIVIGIIVIYISKYTYQTYNYLVNLRMNVNRQYSHIEAHLKKKFDLIPSIVDIVKGYSKHEKGLLTEVTRLRSQWSESKSTVERMKSANILESTLSKLLVIHEKYPRIKADRGFNNIQKSIYYVEKGLLNERKVYNKRVSQYNVKLQEFPSNIIGKIFGFKEREFFKLKE